MDGSLRNSEIKPSVQIFDHRPLHRVAWDCREALGDRTQRHSGIAVAVGGWAGVGHTCTVVIVAATEPDALDNFMNFDWLLNGEEIKDSSLNWHWVCCQGNHGFVVVKALTQKWSRCCDGEACW